MSELFAATMATSALQAQIQSEMFGVPQEMQSFDILEQIPIEDLILVKQEEEPENEDLTDANEDGIPDRDEILYYEEGWLYCETSYSEKCYSCNPFDSDCELREPCICTEDEDGDIPTWCERCPDPDLANDTLPRWLRLTAQIIGTIFEFHVVFLAILPWWAIGIGLILADFVWDYLWYLIFFAFCKPCAYVFVWILNIGTIPLHVMFWYQRLMLELVGFAFDFWTLFFNGDGCFLRWGKDCWFAKKIKDRDHLSYTDLVWLMVKQPAAYPTGFAFSDRQEKWYKVWGFPGTMSEFE